MVTKQQVQTDANQYLQGNGYAPLSPEELQVVYQAVASGASLGEVLRALLFERIMKTDNELKAAHASKELREKLRRRNP